MVRLADGHSCAVSVAVPSGVVEVAVPVVEPTLVVDVVGPGVKTRGMLLISAGVT